MWLQKQARERGDKAFINGLSFKTVYDMVEDQAARLWPGLALSRRLAIWSLNSLPMAILLLALLRLGKEVLFLNAHLTAQDLVNQTEGLGIDQVIMGQDKYQAWVESGLSASFEVLTLDRALDHEKVNLPAFEEAHDESIAVIMNTSATTGKFKSVPLSWGQIRAHVKASQEILGCQADDNWLMVLPLFHVSGFSILMRSLYNGTALTIHEKCDENRVLGAINSGAVNMVSLVPTILNKLMDKIERTHRLRVILLGGEYIPDKMVDQALEQELPLYKTYGMTETFSQCVTFSLLDHRDKKASVGRPLPGMKVTIGQADAEGVGQVWVQGPMLMAGYLGQDPLHGPFNTDDIGYMDPDGYLYILNRRKDLIISGGENIYPKEIEDIVYGLPFVKECAIVPVADPKWGQVPALFLAIDQGDWQAYTGNGLQTFDQGLDFSSERIEPLLIAYLESFLQDQLAKYKVPKYYRLLDALPRNGTGKIVRKDLTL